MSNHIDIADAGKEQTLAAALYEHDLARAAKAGQTIVLARADKTKLVMNGKHEWRDGVLREAYDFEWEGKASVWLNEGEAKDLSKARAYAAAEGYEVFTFPVSEPDPLGKAKVKVVEMAKATEAKQR